MDWWIAAVTRPLLVLPFDAITLSKQLRPNASYGDVVRMFGNSTLRRLLVPHASSLWLRSTYVYPLASVIPPYFNNSFLGTVSLITAISTLDTVIGVTPFERVKVAILQNEKINSSLNFYRGSLLTFQSSLVHTGSFLLMQKYISPFLIDSDPNVIDAIKMGTVFAGVQSTLAYPLITLRARSQASKMSVMELILSHTLRSLYSGWRARFLRGVVIASFDSFWLSSIQK